MRNYILDAANELKEKFKTSCPYQIIEALGINLKLEAGLGELKGFYYAPNSKSYIVINAELSESDARIVAGHELGHHVLHKDAAVGMPLNNLSPFDTREQMEYEANMFASELLISDEDFLQGVREGMDFYTLCSHLNLRPEIVTFKSYSLVQRKLLDSNPFDVKGNFL